MLDIHLAAQLTIFLAEPPEVAEPMVRIKSESGLSCLKEIVGWLFRKILV